MHRCTTRTLVEKPRGRGAVRAQIWELVLATGRHEPRAPGPSVLGADTACNQRWPPVQRSVSDGDPVQTRRAVGSAARRRAGVVACIRNAKRGQKAASPLHRRACKQESVHMIAALANAGRVTRCERVMCLGHL